MFIDEFYRFCQFALKKDNKGNCTPNEFNLAYKISSDAFFVQRYGLPERYTHGQALPEIAYALTQKIEDDLAPFKKEVTLFLDTQGKVNKPSDYSHYIVIYKNVKVTNQYCGDESFKNYSMQSVDVLPSTNWPGRMSSQVVPPTNVYPICKFMSTYIQFNPKNLLSVEFEYLRMPVAAIWAFTTPDGRTPQFDPGTSVDTDWPEDTHYELKIRILQWLGVSIQRDDIINLTQQFKMSGE